MVIIWPLREKLSTTFMQQRPKETGGRMVTKLPTLPWDDYDRPPNINFGSVDRPPMITSNCWSGFGLCATGIKAIRLTDLKHPPNRRRFESTNFMPSVVHGLKPMPTQTYEITGYSKNASNVVIPFSTMSLFLVTYDSGNNLVYRHDGTTISGVNGFYSFNVNPNSNYRVTADYVTGPVAGISLNTLKGLNA